MLSSGLDELFSAQSMPASLAMCLTGERLVVAPTADQVKEALRREKRGAALADSDEYKGLLRTFKPVGTVRFLVNLPRVFEVAKADAPDQDEAAKWMKALGVECLRGAVGHVRIDPPAYDSKFELLLSMKGDRAGVAKILSMDNRPIAPGADVTEAATTCASVNLNIPKLLDEIERILRQIDPAMADQMRTSLEATPMGPGGETINVRKDFLDHLREPLTFSMLFTRPLTPDSLRVMLTLAHRDREAIVRFLSTIAATGMGMLGQARDVRGTQVFDVPMGGVAIAATNDRMIIGNPSQVESAVEKTEGTGLVETAAWKSAAKTVASDAWGFFYQDDRKMLETLLEMGKNREMLMSGGGMSIARLMLMGMLDQAAGRDEASAERARKLLKYYGRTIATASTTDEGIRLTVVTVRPEEK
jgi:hypothetical protein